MRWIRFVAFRQLRSRSDWLGPRRSIPLVCGIRRRWGKLLFCDNRAVPRSRLRNGGFCRANGFYDGRPIRTPEDARSRRRS